jgi:hypothetical protein
VGIDAVELEAMKQPAAFESQGGAVPQPPIDPDKPQLVMPPDALRRIMTMPDEVVTAKLSEPDPPVKVAVGR